MMKKLLIFILALAMMLGTFAACKSGDTGDVTESGDGEVTTVGGENVEPVVQNVSLEGYVLIRPENATADLIKACSEAVKAIMKETKKLPTLNSDFVANLAQGQTVENDEKEILIGATNRKESQELLATLTGAFDYVIVYLGNKVVILGKTDAATVTALNVFLTEYVKDGGVTVPDNLDTKMILSGEGSIVDSIINDYTVVRSANENGDYALKSVVTYRTGIESLSNLKTKLTMDSAADAGKEVLIGRTNRAATTAALEGLGAMDFTVRIKGDKIVLLGGTPVSTISAIDHFIGMIISGELKSLDTEYEYTYRFFEEFPLDPLCDQLETFKLTWAYDHVTPAWMRDFEEKTYSLMFDVRNLSMSHRADLLHYPENSIPAIISAIRAGCDTMEIDIRETKDHVLILMHDDTLTRMTDVSEKAGKNGLPSSVQVADWTYAELQELRLKDRQGRQTDYRIPTLYEAMYLMKDNCFINFDVKTLPLTFTEEIYYMAEEIGCKEILFWEGNVNTMKTYLQKNPGDKEFAAFVDKVMKYALDGGKFRTRYWCKPSDVESGTTDMRYENETRFAELTAQGKTFLWANNIVIYCKWIAENSHPGLSK